MSSAMRPLAGRGPRFLLLAAWLLTACADPGQEHLSAGRVDDAIALPRDRVAVGEKSPAW